ncbi:TetR/AcrR family transcriptional regulator [Burkholderia sp.]|uniref:TetR/AcrR family transcriptional regulator n=1 Tax=Burkholderia sp. TaxID=36773 RepID=UPI00283AA243|nr:TetR/AcrR family transcriptional regulator [Burkholderia sp.]
MAAIKVFSEHGFAGTSATMLTDAMNIGRQSLYDTFGDKWQLYCAALREYVILETGAHVFELRSGTGAFDGLVRMLDRVVREAYNPCLGVSSVCEFGCKEQELSEVRRVAGNALHVALVQAISEARQDGDIGADVEPSEAASFVVGNVAGIRIAARGGAQEAVLRGMARLALRALK